MALQVAVAGQTQEEEEEAHCEQSMIAPRFHCSWTQMVQTRTAGHSKKLLRERADSRQGGGYLPVSLLKT